MSLVNLILEGRKENFIQKFSKKFSEEQLNKIVDKSEALVGNNKYLDFMGNVINPRNFEDDLSIVFNLLTKFSTIGSNLPQKDINQYKTLSELKNALKEYDNKVRREIKTIDDADVVYEDDKMIVVVPKTYKASCQFGAGTKWCTTSSGSYFDKYNEDGKLFYFIDKTKSTSDPTYKVALLQKYDGDRTYFNAVDDSFKTGWMFGTEKLEKILSRIMSYLNSTYAEQIKIWSDKNTAELERQRLNRQREATRLARIRAEQQERRDSDEWNLEDCGDCDEAEKANALFQYLIGQNEIEPITEEEKLQLENFRNELEELETIYNNAENPEELTEIGSRISELGVEIEDLESKQDIYEIIPGDYTHYGLTSFQHGGAEYAVGTESDADDASKEAVRGLLDDVGLEGFNQSFVLNYVDKSEIESYIREFFDYDIRENPEVYLDDEDKELSGNQEKEILKLQEEERNIHQLIGNLQEEKNDLDDDSEDLEEEIDEKINELEERLSEIESKIQEIKDYPDGEYDDSEINRIIDDKVKFYTENSKSFVAEYLGMDYMEWIQNNNMVNLDKLIDGVVDSDGYGVSLNSYDGSYNVEKIDETDYYIVRIN
jgi:hypothetical protein